MQYFLNPSFMHTGNGLEGWKVQSVDDTGQPIDTEYQVTPAGLAIHIVPRDFSTNVFQSIHLEPGKYVLSSVLQSHLQPSPQPDITASFFVVQGEDREMLGLSAPFATDVPKMPRVILEVQGGPCDLVLGLSFWVKQGRFDGQIVVENCFLRDIDEGTPALIITPPSASLEVSESTQAFVGRAADYSYAPTPSTSRPPDPIDELVGLTLSVTPQEGIKILQFLGQLRGEES